MDLEFTDEQQMLRDAVRDLCAKHGDPDHIRELEDTADGFDRAFWQELASMDLIGLTLPPEHGGSGMGQLDALLMHQELGRSIVPSPLLPSAILCGGLLADAGSAEQQATWLPRIASGDAIVVPAWHEAGRSDTAEGIGLTLASDGESLVLDGIKILVPFANNADAFIVLAAGEAGVDLILVEAGTDGISMEQTLVADSSAQFQVVFKGVRVPAANRIGSAGSGWATFENVMDDVLIAVAATAVGGARKALEMTVDYAKERVQFGVPIGSFQGLAHPIADRNTEIDGAETLVMQAAWARDTSGAGGTLPAMAKRFACETYRSTTRTGQQTFGGVGFTRAIDIQLYFRRAKQLELEWFEPATLLDRVAAAELDAADPFVGVDVPA